MPSIPVYILHEEYESYIAPHAEVQMLSIETVVGNRVYYILESLSTT